MPQDHGGSQLDPARSAVRQRLARAHGHLHGVLDMIDEDRPYPEILQQLAAVRAALEKATAVAIDDMIQSLPAAAKQRADIDAVRAAVRTLA